MIRIIDEQGTGKTYRLMMAARENNAIFVCKNPKATEYKAKAYGIDDLQFVSYFDFLSNPEGNYVVDELENFIESVVFESNANLIGYSISKD